MVAIRHLGFLNIWFLGFGKLMCHHAKLLQNRPNRDFEIFGLPSGRGLRCIIVLNFIKIGRTAAEISHLAFCKMAAVRHLGYLNIIFWTFFSVRRANMRYHAKFHPNRLHRCWDITIYPFFSMATVRHFGFVGQIFGTTHNENLLVFYHCAKFDCNCISCFEFEYFVRLTWRRLFTPIFGGFGGKNREKWKVSPLLSFRNA